MTTGRINQVAPSDRSSSSAVGRGRLSVSSTSHRDATLCTERRWGHGGTTCHALFMVPGHVRSGPRRSHDGGRDATSTSCSHPSSQSIPASQVRRRTDAPPNWAQKARYVRGSGLSIGHGTTVFKARTHRALHSWPGQASLSTWNPIGSPRGVGPAGMRAIVTGLMDFTDLSSGPSHGVMTMSKSPIATRTASHTYRTDLTDEFQAHGCTVYDL